MYKKEVHKQELIERKEIESSDKYFFIADSSGEAEQGSVPELKVSLIKTEQFSYTSFLHRTVWVGKYLQQFLQ